jgi:surface antigen
MTRTLAFGLCLLLAGCSYLRPAPAELGSPRKGELPVTVGAPAGAIAAEALPGFFPADFAAMQLAARYALDGPRVNQATTWMNQESQHAGAITPLWLERNPQGEACRSYLQLLHLGRQRLNASATACRQADGRWLIVR